MQQFAASVADPENPGRQINGKPQVGGTRRALGDIGNLGNGLSQKLHVGKDGTQGVALNFVTISSQGRTGVLTRRAAAQLAASTGPTSNGQGNDSWGTRPRASLRPRDSTIPVVGSGHQHSTLPINENASPDVVDMDTMMKSKDIDAVDAHNPLAATQFVKYLYAHYKRIEHKSQVKPDYMSRQNDVNDKMRSILVDWLVDVHLKFKLAPETLFLTVNLIDRFLEVKQVSRKHLQLVGVTAMLIASKYEEIWAPEVRDFVYISDRAYNRDQILNMEKIMLNALRFNLSLPTQHHFLHRFIKAADIVDDKLATNYATYLVELTLPEYSFLQFPPSLVAAAAVSAACSAVNCMSIPHQVVVHSGHSESDIKRCVQALDALYKKAPSASLIAVYKKFSSDRFDSVANYKYSPSANLL